MYPAQKLLCKKIYLGFYFSFLDHCCNLAIITSLSSSVLSKADCSCEDCSLKIHQKCFMWLLDVCLYITHVCSQVLFNGLWLSGLSCLFLEILVHAEGCRFESYHWLLFLFLYSVYTKKKFSHPSSVSYVCAVAPSW